MRRGWGQAINASAPLLEDYEVKVAVTDEDAVAVCGQLIWSVH